MYVFAYICICLHIWIYIMDDMSNKMANWSENVKDIYRYIQYNWPTRNGERWWYISACWCQMIQNHATHVRSWYPNSGASLALCGALAHSHSLALCTKKEGIPEDGGLLTLLQSSFRLALHAFGSPLTILCLEEPCQNKSCVFFPIIPVVSQYGNISSGIPLAHSSTPIISQSYLYWYYFNTSITSVLQ